jgi:hypothetical protein
MPAFISFSVSAERIVNPDIMNTKTKAIFFIIEEF